MKQSGEIHSLGVCENGDVTEAFQNILRETQVLEMPGKTDSGCEMCCQKQGNEQKISKKNSQSSHRHLGCKISTLLAQIQRALLF